MSISTPNPNQGKDDERETSKQNAAPPRPSARRTRRGGTAAPKSEPQAGAEGTDETVDGAELAEPDSDGVDIDVSRSSTSTKHPA